MAKVGKDLWDVEVWNSPDALRHRRIGLGSLNGALARRLGANLGAGFLFNLVKWSAWLGFVSFGAREEVSAEKLVEEQHFERRKDQMTKVKSKRARALV